MSLLEAIQRKTEIIIDSNGGKIKRLSGGAWIIHSSNIILVEGYNPDFGKDSDIHSHRSEIYSILTVLLFLDTYIKYYSIEISNPIKCYIDNLEGVNRLRHIKETPNVFDTKPSDY